MSNTGQAVEFSIKYLVDFKLILEHMGSGSVGIEFWVDWTAVLFLAIVYFLCKKTYRMYKNS